jgi:hypothetical protein
LSAVAVLAERSDIINNIVIDKVLTINGRQRFRLFLDGEFKIIEVDNYLPCVNNIDVTKHTNKKSKKSHMDDLKFSHSYSNIIWVPFLEKAYAKAHGSYQSIHGGHISEGNNHRLSFNLIIFFYFH